MTGNLPWTPTGLSLLQKINDTIQSNGGIEAMYQAVKSEIGPNREEKQQLKAEAVYCAIVKHRMPIDHAANLLGVSEHAVNYRLKQYKDRIAIKHLTESNH